MVTATAFIQTERRPVIPCGEVLRIKAERPDADQPFDQAKQILEQAEDMIAGAASVDVMLVEFDSGLMSIQPVQHIDGFILGGAHRQDVEVAVLVGDPGIELAAGALPKTNVLSRALREIAKENSMAAA
jgi:hypothetical protein